MTAPVIGDLALAMNFAAMPIPYTPERLQDDLAAGVGKILAGVGGNFRLDVDTAGAFIKLRHKDSIYDGYSSVADTTNSRLPALVLTANGFAAGYNAENGDWVNSLVIDVTDGSSTWLGDIYTAGHVYATGPYDGSGEWAAVTGDLSAQDNVFYSGVLGLGGGLTTGVTGRSESGTGVKGISDAGFGVQSIGKMLCTGNFTFGSAVLEAPASSDATRYLRGDGKWGYLASINAKDHPHNAIGNNSNDDTAELQSAFSALVSATVAGATTSGALTTSYSGTVPELEIPSGVYLISDTITLGSYLRVTGKNVIIKMTDPTKPIFDGVAYQWHFEGITFVGGLTHVKIHNDNINSSMVSFEKCEFFLSRSYAIDTYATGGYGHLSTHLTVEKSRFISCNKILNNSCDYATLTKCWIQVDKNNFTASTAAFKNLGETTAFTRLHLDKCVLIPDIGTEGVDRINNVRWIDNYGSFLATNCRFGGEFGGMSICWHIGAYQTAFPWLTNEVAFHDCELFAGPSSRNDSGVIVLQGQVPNRMTIRNCTGPASSPFIVNIGITFSTYFAAFETATGRNSYDYFKVDIRDVIADNPEGLVYGARIPYDLYKYQPCAKQYKVKRNTPQSITNAFASNLVTFEAVVEDNLKDFTLANPTRLVMPKGCSRMRITVNFVMSVDGAAKLMKFAIVDSALATVAADVSLRGINADSDSVSITADVTGAPGTYWHAQIKHQGAAAIDLLAVTASVTPLDYVG